MGRIKELTVIEGIHKRGRHVEYRVTAEVNDEEDIHAAYAELKGLVRGWLSKDLAELTRHEDAKTIEEKKLSVEDVKAMFPEELRELFNYEDKGEYIKITPRQYLGAENFAKITQIVRSVGGDYISAGKDSHYRIPKKRGEK